MVGSKFDNRLFIEIIFNNQANNRKICSQRCHIWQKFHTFNVHTHIYVSCMNNYTLNNKLNKNNGINWFMWSWKSLAISKEQLSFLSLSLNMVITTINENDNFCHFSWLLLLVMVSVFVSVLLLFVLLLVLMLLVVLLVMFFCVFGSVVVGGGGGGLDVGVVVGAGGGGSDPSGSFINIKWKW